MISHRVWIWIGSFLFLLCAALLVWGLWPPGRVTRQVDLSISHLPGAETAEGFLEISSMLQGLILEWSPQVRSGDINQIQLNLVLSQDSGSGILKGEGHEVDQAPAWLVEARLDLPGVTLAPQGAVSQALRAGTSPTFVWSIHPQHAGYYRGTLWLVLHQGFVVGGNAARIPLTSQLIEIQSDELIGLPANGVRVMGAVGIVLSVLITMFGLLEHRMPGKVQAHAATTPASKATGGNHA